MKLKFGLAGNPNCGKTTMFNALTGANQYVGNWPGVTVEKKSGKLKGAGEDEIEIVDLPGIYSLSPYTLEEVVSADFILKDKPDVVIDIVDATNIERNLYLTTQIIETGVPVVIALNMSDLLKKNGMTINNSKLSEILGVPVVDTSALRGTGLKELIATAVDTAKKAKSGQRKAVYDKAIFSEEIEDMISAIRDQLPAIIPEEEKRWYSIKLLEQDGRVLKELGLSQQNQFKQYTDELEKKHDDEAEAVITDQRYVYIQDVCSKAVRKPGTKMSVSDRIDSIVTSRILGLPIFAAVMVFVYYVTVTTVGTVMTDWTNDSFVVAIQDAVAGMLTAAGAGDLIQGLIVDGIIGGLGAVLGFAPQMALLFLLLSILEDVGYMARIAFVMDRVFRHFGLSGKSFIPLLISSGCGIPGIMASRTIEQENDRRLTIMTATFVPCGAKLPVIALMAGVLASYSTGSASVGALLAPIMYFIGVAAVIVSAVILKKTKPFAGEPAPFVMELPAYHIPQAKTVLLHVWERLKSFFIKAGTILFVACVVMWFLSTFGFENGAFGMVEDTNASLISYLGNAIAWIFIPLGFGEWQPVAASIAGFTAKEAIVSTMGVLANVSEELSEETDVVAAAITTWFPTAVAAFSFLTFNLLNSPCLAAIATMAQQMQSRKMFWFAIIYQNVFAYCVSLIIYQVGGFAIGAVGFSIWTVIAFAVLAVLLFLLFRPDPYKETRRYTRSSVEAARG